MLTDPHLRALRPGPTARDVRDAHGLIVRILPSGLTQFAIRYRYRGKQRRLVLGDYPGLSLAKARKRARAAQVAITDGHDPAGEQQAAKTPRTDTVAALADDYLRKHARKFKRSSAEDERILQTDVLPVWGDRSVRDLTRRDVRALVENVADRAPVMGNRVLALVRRLLNFAVDHDWLDASPAARVTKPAPEVSRERVLTDDELRRLWRVLHHHPTTAERGAPGRRAAVDPDDPFCPIRPMLADVVTVRLLTAQRGGEVVAMTWADLDDALTWWTIPSHVSKNKKAHRVPLTARVRSILQAQPHRDDQPLVFAGSGASVRDASKKAPARIARVLGLNDFRGHDLRRSAATRMAEAGVPRDDISAVLNHAPSGPAATQTYDRYSRDAEKRLALETWERTLLGIVEGTTAADVVPIRRRRR